MTTAGGRPSGNNLFLYTIFFFSGFPALIYQIVWQRSLFTIYGVNIESITMVVAAFMLGLGLGSIIGGWISKQPRVPVLLVFGAAELVIGSFGLCSLKFFDLVGSFTLGADPLMTGLLTFSMVLVPTLMMGATLPLLVAHLVRQSANVGRSTGMLYYVNTLGSAFACLLCAALLMRTLGRQGTIYVAALMNMLVSASALVFYARQRGRLPAADGGDAPESATNKTMIPFSLAIALVFFSGFIALSYEITWIRVYSIGLKSLSSTFPLVLSMYLAGIALGSSVGKRFCPDGRCVDRPTTVRALVVFIAFANIFGFLLIPVVARFFQLRVPELSLLFIVPAAGFLGATLPLVSHMSIPPDDNAGAKLSYLYLANILGSTAGSYLTGFVLMDLWPLRGIALFLALLGICMGAMLLVPARLGAVRTAAAVTVFGAVALLLASGSGPLYDRIYERLVLKGDLKDGTRFADVVETKSGVVTVEQDGTIFGEGVYDGCYNVSLAEDRNLVVRAYSLSAFHPAPKEVLLIGLSTGSWAQVIAQNPEVEKLTVVEINPGYTRLIPKYPMVASLLKNPKVHIVIDDGRRWLARNPDRRFDCVVMNTTWHWRAFATNLLSVEFLNLVRAHLKSGGILLYNTTFSPEAARTGSVVFPYAYKFINLLVVSDSPFAIDKARWEKSLRGYCIDGKPALDPSNGEQSKKLDHILSIADSLDKNRPWQDELESRKHILARTKGLGLITDDNMLTEWRGI